MQGPSCVVINKKLYIHDVRMTMISKTTIHNHLHTVSFYIKMAHVPFRYPCEYLLDEYLKNFKGGLGA